MKLLLEKKETGYPISSVLNQGLGLLNSRVIQNLNDQKAELKLLQLFYRNDSHSDVRQSRLQEAYLKVKHDERFGELGIDVMMDFLRALPEHSPDDRKTFYHSLQIMKELDRLLKNRKLPLFFRMDQLYRASGIVSHKGYHSSEIKFYESARNLEADFPNLNALFIFEQDRKRHLKEKVSHIQDHPELYEGVTRYHKLRNIAEILAEVEYGIEDDEKGSLRALADELILKPEQQEFYAFDHQYFRAVGGLVLAHLDRSVGSIQSASKMINELHIFANQFAFSQHYVRGVEKLSRSLTLLIYNVKYYRKDVSGAIALAKAYSNIPRKPLTKSIEDSSSRETPLLELEISEKIIAMSKTFPGIKEYVSRVEQLFERYISPPGTLDFNFNKAKNLLLLSTHFMDKNRFVDEPEFKENLAKLNHTITHLSDQVLATMRERRLHASQFFSTDFESALGFKAHALVNLSEINPEETGKKFDQV